MSTDDSVSSKPTILAPSVKLEPSSGTPEASCIQKRKPLVSLASTSRLDDCTLLDFDLGKTLGTGSFGKVKHAFCSKSGEYVALKILEKSGVLRLKQAEHIKSEKAILRAISHPFIVSLHGSFQDGRNLYLVLEYVPGGEFFSYLRRRVKLEPSHAAFYSAQIVTIFEYLHQFRIAFRDLKPENILIDRRGYLKLTDFGFAKVIKTYSLTVCGTPDYLPPEVLLNKGHTTSVDFWCLGIFLYEMLMGHPPFIGHDTMSTYQKILAGKVAFPKEVDPRGKSLIKNLLQADLTKRFGNLKNGIDDIKSSPWFEGVDWKALILRSVPAPYIPPVEGVKDTSNFENYPDSCEETDVVAPSTTDPFADW